MVANLWLGYKLKVVFPLGAIELQLLYALNLSRLRMKIIFVGMPNNWSFYHP